MDNEIKYSVKQQEFINAVLSGKSVFLTGEAGTGKSFIVQEAIRLLQNKKKQVIVCAPTGIAANNIGGQTMHSMFSLNPTCGVFTYEKCNFMRKEKRRVIDMAKTIFIDEVSMVRSDQLDAINWTMKKNGLGSLKDKQVIFVGDLKQLPPVADDNFMSVLKETHHDVTFIHSHIYKELSVVDIELDEPQRQSDPEFIQALNLVRNGQRSPYFRKFFHTEPKGVVLAPRIETVNRYNQMEFDKLEGDVYTFEGNVEIIEEGTKINFTDFNVEPVVHLKDGCKIMYLKNSPSYNALRNGSMGTFRVLCDIDLKKEIFFIEINGINYSIDYATFSKNEYVANELLGRLELKELANISQVPVKLAYAVSIHKSQGMTLNEATIDLSLPCFVSGQLYVALSRVKSPEGLRIIVNEHDYGTNK